MHSDASQFLSFSFEDEGAHFDESDELEENEFDEEIEDEEDEDPFETSNNPWEYDDRDDF